MRGLDPVEWKVLRMAASPFLEGGPDDLEDYRAARRLEIRGLIVWREVARFGLVGREGVATDLGLLALRVCADPPTGLGLRST